MVAISAKRTLQYYKVATAAARYGDVIICWIVHLLNGIHTDPPVSNLVPTLEYLLLLMECFLKFKSIKSYFEGEFGEAGPDLI